MGVWEDGFAAGWAGALANIAEGRGSVPRGSSHTQIAADLRTKKPKRRKPRKQTAYNRFMKREMKALRRKHPRMKQPQIMKKAAAAWRRKKRG